MLVVPPLPQSYASFEQQSTNLVDDCRATHHPALAHPVQGLQIQLVIGLDRHKAHGRSCDSLGDRLGIDVVALIGFHVRLHILRRYQPHVVSLFPQCSAKKMRTSAASMPINPTCTFAVNRSSCVRENFLRTTTSPPRLSPTR